MAASRWEPLFRPRVAWTDSRCRRAARLLQTAQQLLASPVHTRDAGNGSARIGQALSALREASSHLASSMILMGACKELALRGGSHSPLMPLSSIYGLGDQNMAERNAVTKLRDAWARAKESCAAVELCCGHLSAASVLLGHHRLPGVNRLIEAQRVLAIEAVRNARNLAVECAALAQGAHEDIN